MTSINLNTPNTSVSTILSMPSISDFSKKDSNSKNYIRYSIVPKTNMRKTVSRISAFDWDLNMNELEFE